MTTWRITRKKYKEDEKMLRQIRNTILKGNTKTSKKQENWKEYYQDEREKKAKIDKENAEIKDETRKEEKCKIK